MVVVMVEVAMVVVMVEVAMVVVMVEVAEMGVTAEMVDFDYIQHKSTIIQSELALLRLLLLFKNLIIKKIICFYFLRNDNPHIYIII
uniref:Uncharacterized protein n=1 Tax=viral metagenome TaxID=1070528 RepID=A0A6C0LSQ8_9ZZZZ